MGEGRALPLKHALALGLLHGPTELLPISSSAHTTLLPWLAGWPYLELDPELRKSFEVALHAGTAAALLLHPPWMSPASGSVRPGAERHPQGYSQAYSTPRVGARLGFLAAAVIPPAIAGYALGGRIERRLGTPATIASGLLAGSAAIGGAEICARKALPTRAREEPLPQTPTHNPPYAARPHTPIAAGARDGLALGIAQAIALIPGVSRSGATIAAARARGFSRADADRLSWTVGLPVIAGAALLKGSRLTREETPRAPGAPLAIGAASALLSTLAATSMLSAPRRARLLPACAVYRAGLALLVVRRMRDNTG